MRRRPVVLVLIPLLLQGQAVLAQTGWPGSLGVDRFGVEDGLPGMYVPDLAVTEDGLLWMLSSGRLTSFDGMVFEEHDIEETSDWAGGSLVGIGAGRGDTLWVTVGAQLLSYALGRAEVRARHDQTLRDVWQDDRGRLWAWDDRGVLRLGRSGFERMAELVPGWNWGRDIAEVRPRATPRPDVRIVDTGGGALRSARAPWIVEPLPFPEAWPVRRGAGPILVVRTGPATVEVTRRGGTRVATLPRSPERKPVLLDRRGLLWTVRPGMVEAVGRAGEVVSSLSLEPGARVTAALADGEGNVWLGTVTRGLYRIRVLPVQVLAGAEGLTDGQVLRVSDGGDGRVLVLDHEGRVTRVSRTARDTVFEPSAGVGRATAALTDRRGTVWVAEVGRDGHWLVGHTVAGGEIRVPASRFSPTRIVEDPDEDGLLWMVGGRVRKMRPYAPVGPRWEEPLLAPDWGARELVVGPGGVAWAAGPRGVARISDAGVREFLAEDGFPTDQARALHRDADGTLWIGRYYGGIVRYRDGRFRTVGREDGLWDDVVSSLLEDGDGNFWMGSNRGVHRVARRELDDFLDGHIERVRGRGYGPAAGFRNPEASGWHGHRSPDGRLWFPTFGGVAVIDPVAVMAQEQIPPRVRIKGVYVGGEVIPASSEIRLARGMRRFDVMYGAIALSGPEGMRYELRLEGVDPDWVDAGSRRQVTYGSVPPGRRMFRVRAVSGAGTVSSNEEAITLVVPPYFHETRGFYLLLSMLAGLVLWAAYHLRIRRLRARETTLRRLVDERTEDLARSQARTEEALAVVEAQAEELRTLDEAKSRFFANVSHELRTPLTLVQGPLQDVLDGRLGPTPDPVKEQVEIVLSSGRRLGELVEQLLDVARLEAGRLHLNVRRVDVKPMLDRLVASFQVLGRSRGIALEAALPEGPVPAAVDADRVEKVYANLLSNAMKFTPEGGRVRFMVELVDGRRDEELVATVEDDGPGIPEEALERIFERFHQVDGSSRRSHGGAGLGLALVKEVTELHGGRVEVVSRPGRGSRFTVRIPSDGSGVPAGEAPSAAAVGAVGNGTVRGAHGPDASPPSEPPEWPESEDARRPTVLVVEDHDELRAYLRRHLQDRYRVVEASDGREGLEAARRSVPDLILCDIMMPGMDGEELCRAIRADPELDFLPVIMVTAKASRHSRLSALHGGADDYLVKPFDPEELGLRVDNVLAARRRLRERYREEGRALPFVALELPRTDEDGDFADRIHSVLLEHMSDEDFGVEGMAKALAVSRPTLYRKSDQALGTPPMELLWRFRLRQAAHWLRETDATVSEVAYACGFKTVPHFTRRFKDLFGTTPAAYGRASGETP